MLKKYRNNLGVPCAFAASTANSGSAQGDSKCDHIETDDVEILCITLCNRYTNIHFTNVMINYLQVVNAAGNAVPYLPDGTPSVMVVPVGQFVSGIFRIATTISRPANPANLCCIRVVHAQANTS